MSERADDNLENLLKRLDRVAAEFQKINWTETRGALLLTLLEAEGVRVKVKKRNKNHREKTANW